MVNKIKNTSKVVKAIKVFVRDPVLNYKHDCYKKTNRQEMETFFKENPTLKYDFDNDNDVHIWYNKGVVVAKQYGTEPTYYIRKCFVKHRNLSSEKGMFVTLWRNSEPSIFVVTEVPVCFG